MQQKTGVTTDKITTGPESFSSISCVQGEASAPLVNTVSAEQQNTFLTDTVRDLPWPAGIFRERSKEFFPPNTEASWGGQVNVLTRSGANEFHGSLFGNFQAENLNARDPFLAFKPAFNTTSSAGLPAVRSREIASLFLALTKRYRESRFRRVESNVPTQFLRDPSYVTGGPSWTPESRLGYNRADTENFRGVLGLKDPMRHSMA